MATKKTPEQLEAENAELREKVKQLSGNGGLSDEEVKLVDERIRASGGRLTRQQAIECVQAQARWDRDSQNPNPPKQK